MISCLDDQETMLIACDYCYLSESVTWSKFILISLILMLSGAHNTEFLYERLVRSTLGETVRASLWVGWAREGTVFSL